MGRVVLGRRSLRWTDPYETAVDAPTVRRGRRLWAYDPEPEWTPTWQRLDDLAETCPRQFGPVVFALWHGAALQTVVPMPKAAPDPPGLRLVPKRRSRRVAVPLLLPPVVEPVWVPTPEPVRPPSPAPLRYSDWPWRVHVDIGTCARCGHPYQRVPKQTHAWCAACAVLSVPDWPPVWVGWSDAPLPAARAVVTRQTPRSQPVPGARAHAVGSSGAAPPIRPLGSSARPRWGF